MEVDVFWNNIKTEINSSFTLIFKRLSETGTIIGHRKKYIYITHTLVVSNVINSNTIYQ